jgi:hypothetical protein
VNSSPIAIFIANHFICLGEEQGGRYFRRSYWVWTPLMDVRFGADSGLKSDITALPKSANNGSVL